MSWRPPRLYLRVNMISISVCLPTTGLCRAEFNLSLANFCLYFMGHAFIPNEQQSIILRQWNSSCISQGRESLARDSLAGGCTHVLFIDEDMSFRQDTVHGMLRRQLPIVACNYKMRFEGMPFTAVSEDFKTRIVTHADSPELEPCGNVGFGLCLIERKVFEAIPMPWFPMTWDPEVELYTTEDLGFFTQARRAGFTPMVDHVASRQVEHVGAFRYRWNGPI